MGPTTTSDRLAGTRRHALLALVAAVLGAGGAFLAATVLVADRGIATGTNRIINEPGVITVHNSPNVARDPTDPSNLVVGYRIDRPGFSAGLAWSRDDGRTWSNTELPLPEGLDRPFAPDVAFGPDGILYVAYVNLFGPGNVPQNVWLARSDDGGRTLSDPVHVTGEQRFQIQIAVGGDGTVHLTWLHAPEVGLLSIAGRAPIQAVRSTDGGNTFSSPVRVSDPGRPRVGAASPVVGPDGTLFVLYEDFKGDIRDFQNLEGPPWPEPFALVLTRSTDGGATFAPGVEFESDVVPTERFLVFLPEFPSLAVGPQGRLFAAWADGRNDGGDVFLRRSDDGGASWTDPIRVNDDPPDSGATQDLPTVDVAPDGRVDVLYYDRRLDTSDRFTNAFVAISRDHGATFETLQASVSSFSTEVGARAAEFLPIDFGTRLALSSTADGAFAAWTDTRFGDPATARQDVLGVRVLMPDEGADLRLAAAVALLVAAAVSLGLWWRRRPAPQRGASAEDPAAET